MDYGKQGTEKKIQAASSNSRKYATRVFLSFLKTCLVCFVLCGRGALQHRHRHVNRDHRQRAGLDIDSIVPRDYATTVYDSAGQSDRHPGHRRLQPG